MGDGPTEQVRNEFEGILSSEPADNSNPLKTDVSTSIKGDGDAPAESEEENLSNDDDNRSVISDDPVPWNVDDIPDYPYDLVFDRLSALGNLTRRNAEILTIDPADFEAYLDEGGVWVPNAVLRELQNGGFHVNHAVFRSVFRNPHISIETSIARPAHSLQRSCRQAPRAIVPLLTVAPAADDESWLDAPNMGAFGPYTIGVRSSHPTGQVPREHETFEQDSANPSQWLVRFRRELPDGTVYERVDPLRNFDATAVNTLQPTEVQTELGGEPARIPTFAKYDKGFWFKVEGQPEVGGEFRRHYNVPPKDKAKQDSKASVTYVFRRYNRITGQYSEQYKWGVTWDEWDRNVSTFNINDTEMCRVFNRWLLQIMEKWDHRYEKRETRECWKGYELRMLREYFNTLIADKGLMEAHSNAGWQRIVSSINKERDDRNPGTGHRNENGVSSQAERHSYAPNIPRLGIQEWRQLGSTLRDFKKKYPGILIPASINKPRNCIPLDDIADKVAGGSAPPVAEYKASGFTRKEIQGQTQTKILVKFEDGQFKVSDRFGGALVNRFFGQPTAATEDPTNELATDTPADGFKDDREEQEVGEQSAEWDADASGDEFEEPAPKRQKH